MDTTNSYFSVHSGGGGECIESMMDHESWSMMDFFMDFLWINLILGVSLKILIIQAEAKSAKTYTRMINLILQKTSTWTVVLFVEQL